MTRRRALRWTLGSLVALSALVVLGRMFLFGVYRVEKRSMEPAIRSGDVVLVWLDGGHVPRRFGLVVVSDAEGEEPLVKRAVGLPGEEVELELGDVLVDGAHAPITAPRPPPVPLFDDRLQDVEDAFDFARDRGVWTREGDVWRLDASAAAPGTQQDRMFYARRALDGWLGDDGELAPGSLEMVNDLVLDLEVRLDDPPAHLRLGLLEMADQLEVRLEPLGEGRWRARLVDRWVEVGGPGPGGAGEDVLAEGELVLAPGEWHALRLANVDDQVGFVVDGRTVLLASYAANRFHPRDAARRGLSLGSRAWFGGGEGRASFRRVRLSRDLYYTRRGDVGVGQPVQLGPAELFVLGDNSAESRDSRDFGPVPLGRVLGRPAGLLWPPGRSGALPDLAPLVPPPE